MDPNLSTALINGGSKVLGSAFGKKAEGPSSAESTLNQTLDFGGWTVATGSGKAGGGINMPPWLILGVVAIAALAWKNKKAS